jgi:monoamine oxidase
VLEDRPLSRRELLSALGAGLAGVLLDPASRPSLAAQARAPRIVIVGAGIAGLTAALRLADAKVPCTVYEASPRLGGRMFSNSPLISGGSGYWDDGQVSEWGGELIDTSHETIQALAHRFSLPLDDVRAAEPPRSTDTYFFDGDYYRKADEDFAAIFPALTRDADRAGYPTTYARHNHRGVALDNLSVYDWIERRVPGGHRSALGKLLDVAYTIEYGADTADQSSLNLVYLLSGSSGKSLEVFGESDERFHVRGGNQRVPLAIAQSLPAGTVVTGHRLTSIAASRNGAVSLTFDAGSGAVTVTADRVILALPFAVLRNLDFTRAGFNHRKRIAILELGAGRNSKLMVQFRQRLWNHPGRWGIGTGGSYTDLPYQSSWEVTRAQPGGSGILVGYTGGSLAEQYVQREPFTTADDPLTAEDAAEQAAEFGLVYPGLENLYNGKANLSQPFRSPYLKLAYSYWRVGQYHRFAGYERVRQGHIHFAGEHCSVDFQGFMEGGAAEGLRAANEVLRSLRG